jgi:PKD repeat protein
MGNLASNKTGDFTIPNGGWSHVVVEIPATSGTVTVYVNGTSVATMARPPGAYGETSALVIGSNAAGTSPTYNINEFRLSNTLRWRSSPFSTPYAQYVGTIAALGDYNPNSTLRYKTNPGGLATIYNQTNNGVRNRTVQIQNASRLNNITVSVNYDPLVGYVKGIYANQTDYPDMWVESSSIDNTNGIITVKMSRTNQNNPIVANLDTRINLVDFEMLYYNYTSAENESTYFTNAYIGDNRTTVLYPPNEFIMTPVTYGTWDFYPDFTASPLVGYTNQPTVFNDTTEGYPTSRNWSFGDGTWSNGTSRNVTHTYTSIGSKTVSLVDVLLANLCRQVVK